MVAGPGAVAEDEAVRPGLDRLARAFTEVLAPWVIVLALPLFLAFHVVDSALPALGWGLLTGLCGSVIPMGFILWALKRGRLTDHHVGLREQRLVPLLVGGGSVLAGVGLLLLTHAPSSLIALCAAEVAGLAVAVPVSLRWKISLHAMVAAGGAAMLLVTYGPVMLPLAVPLLGVCWSRVRLRDHTIAQVVVGAVVGIAVCGPVYLLLR